MRNKSAKPSKNKKRAGREKGNRTQRNRLQMREKTRSKQNQIWKQPSLPIATCCIKLTEVDCGSNLKAFPLLKVPTAIRSSRSFVKIAFLRSIRSLWFENGRNFPPILSYFFWKLIDSDVTKPYTKSTILSLSKTICCLPPLIVATR